jgi:hypothetical protein
LKADLTPASNTFTPTAVGELAGTFQGVPTSATVSWLIDTGSDMPLVRNASAQLFDWVPPAVGQFGYGTAGGPAIAIARDPIVRIFSDVAGTPFAFQGWMGVKPNDDGSDVVGVNALAAWGAELTWDAATGVGRIEAP